MQKDAPERPNTRVKELPDLTGEELKQLLEEGMVRLQRSREALKNNPDRPTPWEDITPAPLKFAIEHIRKEFGTKKWQLEMRAECGCYLALRPYLAIGPKFKGGLDNLIPLQKRAAWLSIYGNARESEIFKFWSDQFSEGLAELIIQPFSSLLRIGLTQKAMLDREPVQWAKTHVANFLDSLKWTLPSKIKAMCDEQKHRSDFETEHFLAYCSWVYWRAPRFIHMQPSGNAPYDPATAWEREDAEKTEKLLQGLTSRMLDVPRFKLDDLAGEAYVSLASTPIALSEIETKPPLSPGNGSEGLSGLNLPASDISEKKSPVPAKKVDLSEYLDQADLTDRQRECISLKFEYGLTVTEIAERLGLTRKTVDEHIEAANRKLRLTKIKDKVRGQKNRFNPEE
jgi:DNA-binding CsgD family transcriptional regulator